MDQALGNMAHKNSEKMKPRGRLSGASAALARPPFREKIRRPLANRHLY
jgi:hypothetical protein